MISYVYDPNGGLYRPVIVCDACAHPITESGNAYWVVHPNGEIHPQVWHTHKYECARLDQAIVKTYGGAVLSEELAVWLVQLRNNFDDVTSRQP